MNENLFINERDKEWLGCLVWRGIDEESLKGVMRSLGYENPDETIQAVYRYSHLEHMRPLYEKLTKEQRRELIRDLAKLSCDRNDEALKKMDDEQEHKGKLSNEEKQEILEELAGFAYRFSIEGIAENIRASNGEEELQQKEKINKPIKGGIYNPISERERINTEVQLEKALDYIDKDIPEITKEEIIEIIENMKRTSGYESSDDIKKAIASGEVKVYSRARLNMWERYENMLDEGAE